MRPTTHLVREVIGRIIPISSVPIYTRTAKVFNSPALYILFRNVHLYDLFDRSFANLPASFIGAARTTALNVSRISYKIDIDFGMGWHLGLRADRHIPPGKRSNFASLVITITQFPHHMTVWIFIELRSDYGLTAAEEEPSIS
jgi:hypothetical protein